MKRRAAYGANAIVAETGSPWREVFLETARDPMIWFLVATAALFFWLGDYTETIVLLVALIPIAGMDAYLHRRTQASTEGLLARLATTARVLRDGVEAEVPAADLVPGDLVIVAAGAYFPADGLILSGASLQADESTLTGEALPVRKTPISAPPDTPHAASIDGVHWGMAGTRLLTGEARLRVALTGRETLYGEIAELSRTTQVDRTPLQEAIAGLVRILLVLALLLCAVLAVVRYLQGYGVVDALLSAVTLAIAALPEEFPVVFSFFLGVGVYRLAKQQALVRRAVVVENIGRITCICTDKTGTLTEGRLMLDHVAPAADWSEAEVLAVGATAARAETGDPMDLCLLERAAPMVGEVEAVFPFTEDRLREVVALRRPDATWKVAMKGAPETVIGMCGMSEEARAAWRDRTQDLAGTGHKVIAVASASLDRWTGDEPDAGFDFAGLLAFSDPPRAGVAEAVREARRAGIRVIMITGDHPRTAAAIAREIGIGAAEPRVIDGSDLAARLGATDDPYDFDVVARCTPSQKLTLVQALRQRGERVAVTGDGVNDAPALRGADLGIAMGERGTRSAREVASIVLLDDNFATIMHAIAEGRQLFRNLRLSFAYLMMMHAPLVFTAALVPLLGYPLLYLPIHIVWLELIIHPTAMLVFHSLSSRDPLSPVAGRAETRLSFFVRRDWLIIGLVGLIATGVTLGGYVYNLGGELDVAHARAMALASLIFSGVAMVAGLARLRSVPARVAVLLPVVSVVAAIQFGPLAAVLHLSGLHPVDWGIATLGAVLVGVVAVTMKDGVQSAAR